MLPSVRRLAWFPLAVLLSQMLPTAGHAQPPVRTKVTGEVIDSTTGQPLPGATVQLVAANNRILAARSDTRGQFLFDSVPAGVYLAGFLHPRLDSLGVESSLLRVEVTAAELLRLSLGTPSTRTLISARCGTAGVGPLAGLFFGTVRDARTGQPVGGARVRAQYTETIVTAKGLERRPQFQFATATADGAFAVCGLPNGGRIVARASATTDSSGFVEVPMPAGGLLVRDLYVGTARRTAPVASTAPGSRAVTSQLQGTARLRGVVRGTNGQLVNGARLVVGGSGREEVANANGQFALGTLPEGSYTLEARAVGFQPLRLPVDLLADRETVADVTLSALTPNLDTLRVRANRTVPLEEFNRRRRLGFGYFLDEEAIAKKAPTFMGDIFRGTPGVVTIPGQFARDRVLLRGTGMTGDCAPAVFVNGLFVNIEDGDMDPMINPKDVRAVEVYGRTSSIPVQFQTRNGCGSVVIWTGARADESTRR